MFSVLLDEPLIPGPSLRATPLRRQLNESWLSPSTGVPVASTEKFRVSPASTIRETGWLVILTDSGTCTSACRLVSLPATFETTTL